jgi:rare lipoprotein A
VAIAASAGVFAGEAHAECGVASWYGGSFHGRRTANGEIYNMYAMTAAHKGLRFGSRVLVTHRGTGRSITVRINDRGPYIAGRIIDLSNTAKRALGMDGIAPVCIEVTQPGDGRTFHARASGRLKGKTTRVASRRGQKMTRLASSAKTGGKLVRAGTGKQRRAVSAELRLARKSSS